MPYACSKLHVPDNLEALLIRSNRFTPDDIEAITRVVLGPAALDLSAARSRTALNAFRSRLSPPDPRGHIHYSGTWPPDRKLPTLQIGGIKYDAVSLVRSLLDITDDSDERVSSHAAAWIRTCGSWDCVEPAHFRLGGGRSWDAASNYAEFWESQHPVNFHKGARPKYGWGRSDTDATVYLCKFGHVLEVYNPLRRSAYCTTCRTLEAAWGKQRSAWLRHVDRDGMTPDERRSFLEWMHAALVAREAESLAQVRATHDALDALKAGQPDDPSKLAEWLARTNGTPLSPEPAYDGPTLSDILEAEARQSGLDNAV